MRIPGKSRAAQVCNAAAFAFGTASAVFGAVTARAMIRYEDSPVPALLSLAVIAAVYACLFGAKRLDRKSAAALDAAIMQAMDDQAARLAAYARLGDEHEERQRAAAAERLRRAAKALAPTAGGTLAEHLRTPRG